MEVSKHEPGTFSWADLATTDGEGAKRFYTQILGLTATDIPMGDRPPYVMLGKNDKKVCALLEMDDEMRQQMGGRPAWHTYFTVESADAAAARVKELGGAIFMGPFDAMDSGRMAIAQDPTGAFFSVWEPRSHTGAQVFGEPGALAWTELYTHDTTSASRFYESLFGWSVNVKPGAVGSTDEYFEFHIGGRSATGMLAIKEEWGEVPPYWSIYFAVADLDDAIERAKSMGAREVMPPMEVEGVGRFVPLQDPQGAYVNFMEAAMSPA